MMQAAIGSHNATSFLDLCTNGGAETAVPLQDSACVLQHVDQSIQADTCGCLWYALTGICDAEDR